MRKFNKDYLFISRNDEKSEIKTVFDKLFVYSSKDQINKINTKQFYKDFEEIVQEVECQFASNFP